MLSSCHAFTNQVLTFDDHGVSGHRNHRDTSAGVRAVFLTRAWPTTTFASLVSRPLVTKYLAVVDAVVLATLPASWSLRPSLQPLQSLEAAVARAPVAVVVRVVPFTAHRAMTRHASQYVWYRRLFVVASSYSYVNALVVMT